VGVLDGTSLDRSESFAWKNEDGGGTIESSGRIDVFRDPLWGLREIAIQSPSIRKMRDEDREGGSYIWVNPIKRARPGRRSDSRGELDGEEKGGASGQ